MKMLLLYGYMYVDDIVRPRLRGFRIGSPKITHDVSKRELME